MSCPLPCPLPYQLVHLSGCRAPAESLCHQKWNPFSTWPAAMQWWWESFRSEIFFFSLWQIFVILSCHFLTLPRDLTFSSKVYRWPQIKTIRILEWDLYSPNKYTSITIQFWQQSGQDRSWRREEGWALGSWEPRALQVHKCSSLPGKMQIRN